MKLKPIFKYSIKKSDTVEKLEALYNGQIIVSKWVIVVSGFVLFFCAAFFVTSIVVATLKKPNGLYTESCAKRPCEKKLGLSCINETCQCPKNQFYRDRCYNLSTYGEFCYQDKNCRSEELLHCSVISKCDCNSDMYWNIKKRKCVPRKLYNEKCDGDQCKTSLNLTCNLGACACQNSSTYFKIKFKKNSNF